MFWFIVDVLTLRRLGLGRPFRYVLLAIFGSCLIAGLIYTVVVFRALAERSHSAHVYSHSTQ